MIIDANGLLCRQFLLNSKFPALLILQFISWSVIGNSQSRWSLPLPVITVITKPRKLWLGSIHSPKITEANLGRKLTPNRGWSITAKKKEERIHYNIILWFVYIYSENTTLTYKFITIRTKLANIVANIKVYIRIEKKRKRSRHCINFNKVVC